MADNSGKSDDDRTALCLSSVLCQEIRDPWEVNTWTLYLDAAVDMLELWDYSRRNTAKVSLFCIFVTDHFNWSSAWLGGLLCKYISYL